MNFLCINKFWIHTLSWCRSSNSFEWDFHGGVDLLVIFWDWFDIWVPAIFPTNLSKSSLCDRHIKVIFAWLTVGTKTGCKRIIGSTERLGPVTITRSIGHILPSLIGLSQEWYWVCELLGASYLINNFPSIWNISIQDERCGIKRSLKLTLRWSHRWAIFWSILNAQSLNFLTGHRFGWSILPEELRISHCWVIEGYVVVHWAIKVFSVSGVPDNIVLRAFYVEIWNPSQLTINVPIFWDPRIIWHSSSFNIIHFIGVWLPLGLNQDRLFCLWLLIKELFIVRVVNVIENRRTMVVPLDPLLIGRCKHSIVGIFLNNHFYSGFSVGRVGSAHPRLLFENAGKSSTTQRWFAIKGRHWWSKLWINDNVFCIGHIGKKLLIFIIKIFK